MQLGVTPQEQMDSSELGNAESWGMRATEVQTWAIRAPTRRSHKFMDSSALNLILQYLSPLSDS